MSAAQPVENMFFDHYCREPKERNLARLRREWQLDAVGTIYLSKRPNGHYAVLEGRHRVMVAREMGVTHLPARIYNDLSYEQEAALYNLFNRYQSHSAMDRLRGRYEAKVPKVLDMSKIIRKFGLDWDFETKGTKGLINSAATIEKVYDTWGAQVLHDTIALLHDAWGQNRAAYQADAIAGVAQFLARYGGYTFSLHGMSNKPFKYDRSRMLNLMRDRGIKIFRMEAGQISILEHLRQSHSFGRAMRSIYNLHLRGSSTQLPDWPDRLFREPNPGDFRDRVQRGWATRREAVAAGNDVSA